MIQRLDRRTECGPLAITISSESPTPRGIPNGNHVMERAEVWTGRESCPLRLDIRSEWGILRAMICAITTLHSLIQPQTTRFTHPCRKGLPILAEKKHTVAG